MYDGIQLFCGAEREAVEDGLLEGAPGRFLHRLGPVHARQAAPVMAAVCILSVADDDARVEERAAYGPQQRRDLARRQQIVDMDDDLGPLQREVLRWFWPELLRAGLGRLDEDMVRGYR